MKLSPALLLALLAGGALGTVSRAVLGSWVQRHAGVGFPVGTLAVNLLGSFVLGAVVGAAEQGVVSPAARLFLAVGVCGAFTTFSTFGLETVALLQGGAWGRAVAYALASLLLGLVAVAAGLALAPHVARLVR